MKRRRRGERGERGETKETKERKKKEYEMKTGHIKDIIFGDCADVLI